MSPGILETPIFRPRPLFPARLLQLLPRKRAFILPILGHFLLYNVGCLRDFGKFDVIAIGKNRDEASARLEEDLPRRLAGVSS
jgi:hypothetical protein